MIVYNKPKQEDISYQGRLVITDGDINIVNRNADKVVALQRNYFKWKSSQETVR